MNPRKYPQNLHTPKNIHFYDTPKNIEVQNFVLQKRPSLYMYENIRVPPPSGCYLLYSSFYLSEHEKDILNGIILGVTVVSSIIIFGIIVLFIYKKRHSFRDIIITKTAVAKSNSYKSNVGCTYNIITIIIPCSLYIYMGESFQDCSRIQDFEADFPQKVSLKNAESFLSTRRDTPSGIS